IDCGVCREAAPGVIESQGVNVVPGSFGSPCHPKGTTGEALSPTGNPSVSNSASSRLVMGPREMLVGIISNHLDVGFCSHRPKGVHPLLERWLHVRLWLGARVVHLGGEDLLAADREDQVLALLRQDLVWPGPELHVPGV